MRAQQDRFDEWVTAGLLETATAERLRRYEADQGRAEGTASEHASPLAQTPDAQAPKDGRRRALALVGELLGYLGAVLAITAISFLVSRTWSDIPSPGRVAVVATLTVIVAASAGWAARSLQDAGQRLASALFLATVVCTGWLAWVSVDAAGLRDGVAGLWTLTAAAIVAAVVYVFRRRAVAQLALLASCVGVAAMTVEVLDATDGRTPGIVIAAVGATWLVLAALRILTPAPPALIAGGLVTLFGVNTGVFDEGARGLTLTVGVGIAVAMLSLAVLRNELVTLMVPGAIGLLTFVPQLIEHLVGGAVATMSAILVTGVALILVAVRMLRAPRPQVSPPAQGA